MNILKIKIEGPQDSGRTTLEYLIRELLVSLEDTGRIGMVRRSRVEHEIEVEIESLKALIGK